jgi:hypothetical protein
MFNRPTMRRALVAALASASLLAPAATSATNAEARSVPLRVCEYEWQRGTWHIKQLIRCAASRWSVPGGAVKAIEVGDCESHLDAGARSSGGSYAGLYQQSTRYWPSRATRFGQGDRSVFNGRANIIVSIRMAHADGSWSTWAGCA